MYILSHPGTHLLMWRKVIDNANNKFFIDFLLNQYIVRLLITKKHLTANNCNSALYSILGILIGS